MDAVSPGDGEIVPHHQRTVARCAHIELEDVDGELECAIE
jgi:hypothetical protein